MRGQAIKVASVDPVAAIQRTGNPALESTAEEVRSLLSAAVSNVAA
jgi:hypothetical protein